MNVDYNKLMELIEARRQANPEADAALSALAADVNTTLAMENKGEGPTPDDLVQLWNLHKAPVLSACEKLTDKRRKAARARLREWPDRQDWLDFVNMINNSAFMTGKNSSGWKANFDFFVKPESILKFKEGRYSFTAPAASKEEGYRGMLDNRG